jgi:hypothetical protein
MNGVYAMDKLLMVTSAVRNDTIQFSGGHLTDNEFWKKSQNFVDHVLASSDFDHALEAKDEWGACVG